MSGTIPEQRLAAAILAQAYSDMFLLEGGVEGGSPTVSVQAMRFLTDQHGKQAYWRNKWCSSIDRDGDALAARVRLILDGKITPAGTERIAKNLERARDRWRQLSHVPKLSGKPTRLPSIKRAPLPPPSIQPPRTTSGIEPSDVDFVIPDDPFYPSSSGHLRVSRRWEDGETSRYLGPLPSLHSKLGQALWTITQAHRVGRNSLITLSDDPDDLLNALQSALPNCELSWTTKGKRLPEYQLNAGLRLYLKQLAKAA